MSNKLALLLPLGHHDFVSVLYSVFCSLSLCYHALVLLVIFTLTSEYDSLGMPH